MKMFVWQYVDGLTDNYHDEGGAVVIAEDLELARSLLLENRVLKTCGALTLEPDYVASVKSSENKVFVFPDAGCC